MTSSLSKVIKIDKSTTQLTPVSDKLLAYLKDEELLKLINEKNLRVKERSYDLGYKKGFQDAKEEQQQKFSNSNELLNQSIQEMNRYVDVLHKELEEEWVHLVLGVAEVVLRHELSKPGVVSEIIKEALNKIPETRQLVLKLHPTAGEYFEQIVADLKKQNIDLGQAKIEIDPQVGEGGCFIETDKAVVDARIDKIIFEVRQKIEESIKWDSPA